MLRPALPALWLVSFRVPVLNLEPCMELVEMFVEEIDERRASDTKWEPGDSRWE